MRYKKYYITIHTCTSPGTSPKISSNRASNEEILSPKSLCRSHRVGAALRTVARRRSRCGLLSKIFFVRFAQTSQKRLRKSLSWQVNLQDCSIFNSSVLFTNGDIIVSVCPPECIQRQQGWKQLDFVGRWNHVKSDVLHHNDQVKMVTLKSIFGQWWRARRTGFVRISFMIATAAIGGRKWFRWWHGGRLGLDIPGAHILRNNDDTDEWFM